MLRSPSTHHHPRLNQGPGLGPGHHQLTPNSHHYSSSPASTCSDEDSDHSQPNDLSSKHSSSHYYGSGHHNSSGGYHGSGHHGTSPYVATNECRIIEYRGARIAAFLSANKNPAEYLLCLPQAFELFLKHLVGGLHTVYTKLKRLDIVPIVCNVEQVRILRGLGAIQPGVNRCKLLSTKDFDVLFKDCTTASRPGRPPKRSPVAGMVSPVPTTLSVTVASNANQPPYLGFPPSKKPRFADDLDFGRDSPDLKGHQGNNSASNANSGTSASSNVAAMLAANGYSAAFPFLHHLANSNANSASQQQQLAAAAAALGLPGLPTSRFGNSSPTPTSNQSLSQSNGLTNVTSNGDRGDRNNSSATGGSSDTPNVTSGGGSGSTSSSGGNNDFNQTAAYLWLLSQQQQQQHQSVAAAAAAAALNLTGSRHSTSGHGHRGETLAGSTTGGGGSSGTPNSINGTGHPTSNNVGAAGGGHSPRDDLSDLKNKLATSSGNSGNNNNSSNINSTHGNGTSNSHHNVSNGGSRDLRNVAGDESTDDEEDDIESHNSSHSDNPVSSSGFNGVPLIGSKGSRMSPSTLGSRAIDRESGLTLGGRGSDSPMAESPAITGLYGPEQHCLETLLRNIKGLLAIATHNARQQQTQLHLAKEYQAEMATQIERERLAREAIEKQLNEEQKIRMLFQKRYKKERRFRRRLEQELHNQQMKKTSGSSQLNISANCDRTTGEVNDLLGANNSTNNNSNNTSSNNNNSNVTTSANASSPNTASHSSTNISITNTTTANANTSSNVTNLFNSDDANEDSHDKGSLVPSSPAGEEEPDQPPSVEAAQIEATE